MANYGTYTQNGYIIRARDNASIPPDPANRDYQEALAAIAAGDTITAYSPPPPSTNPNDYPLRPDQFWSMMDIAGLRAKVLAAIDAIPDPVQKIIASNKLNHTLIFERSNPLFETLKGAVGMTDAQIDAMWMQAKDIP